jgi:hypothetical protein
MHDQGERKMAGVQVWGAPDPWIVEITKKADQAAAAKFRRTIVTAAINAASAAAKRTTALERESNITETERCMMIKTLSEAVTWLDKTNGRTPADTYHSLVARFRETTKAIQQFDEKVRQLALDGDNIIWEELSSYRNAAIKAMPPMIAAERMRTKVQPDFGFDEASPKAALAPFLNVRENKVIRLILLKHWGRMLGAPVLNGAIGKLIRFSEVIGELTIQEQQSKSRIASQTTLFDQNKQLAPLDSYYQQLYKKVVGGYS